MPALDLDPKVTALVVIDLQRGIVSRDVAPHSARDVVARSARLAAHAGHRVLDEHDPKAALPAVARG